MFKFSCLLVVLAVGISCVESNEEKDKIVDLLKRILEQTEEPSCDNHYKRTEKRGLVEFTPCDTARNCASNELCCPTRFFSVCVKKSDLMSKPEDTPNTKPATTTTLPPPPPTATVQVNDAPTGICSTLPKSSLFKRGLSELIQAVDKKTSLIEATSCSQLNIQDVCTDTEVCCDSPIGKSCFPLSDTAAGNKKWCSKDSLC